MSEVNNERYKHGILRRNLFRLLHYPPPHGCSFTAWEGPSGGVEAPVVFPRVAPVCVMVGLLGREKNGCNKGND